MEIKKAVIPVAGKGTRFLPATKEIPKEMIPINGIPMIHYVVQEAIDSGIEEIVFVSSKGKEALERYFSRNYELEKFLEGNNKIKELELIQSIGTMAEISTVNQEEQLGLGHAVNCAKEVIGKEKSGLKIYLNEIVHLRHWKKGVIDWKVLLKFKENWGSLKDTIS